MADSIGQKFMELSQFKHLAPSEMSQGASQPPLEMPYLGGGSPIDLPHLKDSDLGQVELSQVINQRRTLRQYSPQSLTLGELSFLLWNTHGVRGVSEQPALLRPVPSAGGLNALETYLLANRVEGLQPGLYRFLASQHQVGALDLTEGLADRVVAVSRKQAKIAESAVTFIWVADFPRLRWRFVDRGYRYLFLDAGHVCQNLYLAAEAIGCGVCAIGSYEDEELNQLLGLDGEDQFVVYMAALGKKPEL